MCTTVGFDITAKEISDVLFRGADVNASDIASKASLEFEDISAKFLASARVSAGVDLAVPSLGAASLSIDNGTVALGLGFGLEERQKFFFDEIDSVPLSLRQSSWQQIGAFELTLPVNAQVNLPFGGGLDVTPIVSIKNEDLFGQDVPSFSVDFDLR